MEKTAMQQLIEWARTPARMEERVSIYDKMNELLEVEKQQLIGAVNDHDKKCCNAANSVVRRLRPDIDPLFEHDYETGVNHYNSKFQ